ncbi:MAG: type II toxin-antitoxin system RelE/ParE family toxin [Oscillospiraceae bacterium]|nr:type II toxin-antitoxin system RelE/ParE family toxin [Oscillospiraceae bacterium]
MSDHAFRDLDGIYEYIARVLMEPGIALSLVDEIESTVLSLDTMPHRCPERKVGAYANRGYRQLFVKNYTVLFRIDEKNKQVIIVTIRYSSSAF